MHDIALIERRCDRERRARKEAEELLEAKSRELYRANDQLRALADALAEQANELRSILDTAADAIVTVDEQGRIRSFNPAAEAIFGYSATEAREMQFVELLAIAPDSDVTRPAAALDWDALKQLASGERLGRRRDGREVSLEVSVGEKQGPHDRSLIVMIRDVSSRKELEAQLSHAQKMESVGQLAAGIAHEINTPIQYVGENVRFLDDAFGDLERLLNLYEQLREQASTAVTARSADQRMSCLLEQLATTANEVDLQYLREDIPSAIRQSREGAERVASIVSAMKEFSHPGETRMSAISLNAALDSTLTVSRNEWKYVARIETQFDPELPPVRCLAGELNQAFLNLIVNAAHAIGDAVRDRPGSLGTIHISTHGDGDFAEIRIRDTGTGIPEHIRSKIFDPFFTTKPVGVGTGQGLAIVYSVIVEKHRGTLELISEVGKGTTFVIRLPFVPEQEG
ncbi:MAG: PAS domain S-box protein [Planctomycetales bacterium]|nr:PAS domain S-box protein [Planctomycetales bacterium]